MTLLHGRPRLRVPAVSIRTRLTMLFTTILVLTLAVFGLFVYVTLQGSLERDIDDALQQRAGHVNSAVVSIRAPLRGQRFVVPPNPDAFAQADTFVQIVDFEGSVFTASDNLGTQQLPYDDQTLAITQSGHAYFETVRVGTEELRLFNTPLLFGDQTVGLLQVGRTMRTMEAALQQLRLLLIGGGLAVIVLSGLLGSALARAALRPIDRLTQAAHGIGLAQDFARRVVYHGPADEVGRLAATFNEMLSRLHEAFGRVEAALAAQRRFVADASHELRTPLTTVRGNAALLRRTPRMAASDREEALLQISTEAERMSRLVTDLLTLARADAGLHLQRAVVAIRPVVEEVHRQLQLLANGRTVALGALTDAQVIGDADHLKQLLLILSDNALKYTPPQGKVTLGAGQAGKWLELTVADTGVGIAAKDLPHIFERFYRADETRSTAGTGLGLSIARWIVEEHGGEITVTSEPGKSTLFTVLLPLRQS